MKRWSILFVALFLLSINVNAQNPRMPVPAERNAKREVLTNDSIISLVKANFKEKTK